MYVTYKRCCIFCKIILCLVPIPRTNFQSCVWFLHLWGSTINLVKVARFYILYMCAQHAYERPYCVRSLGELTNTITTKLKKKTAKTETTRHTTESRRDIPRLPAATTATARAYSNSKSRARLLAQLYGSVGSPPHGKAKTRQKTTHKQTDTHTPNGMNWSSFSQPNHSMGK